MLAKSIKSFTGQIQIASRAFGAKGTSFQKFNWEDPLDLHGKLTDEEQMIWEVAKNYSQEKL